MVPMKALVGFADRIAATEANPSGSYPAGATFNAPNADAAKHLEGAGLAERDKTPSPPAKA